MFELKEVSREVAHQALKDATYKLPKKRKEGEKIKHYYKIIDKNEEK